MVVGNRQFQSPFAPYTLPLPHRWEEELFCLGRVFPGFCEGEDRREARAEVKKGVSFGYGLGKGLEVGWEVP